MEKNTKIALGIAGALTAVAAIYILTKKHDAAPAPSPQPSAPPPQPSAPLPTVVPWDPSQPWTPPLPGVPPSQTRPDLQLPEVPQWDPAVPPSGHIDPVPGDPNEDPGGILPSWLNPFGDDDTVSGFAEYPGTRY